MIYISDIYQANPEQTATATYANSSKDYAFDNQKDESCSASRWVNSMRNECHVNSALVICISVDISKTYYSMECIPT